MKKLVLMATAIMAAGMITVGGNTLNAQTTNTVQKNALVDNGELSQKPKTIRYSKYFTDHWVYQNLFLFEYDEQMRVTVCQEKVPYNNSTLVISKKTYEYDEAGHVVTYIEYKYDKAANELKEFEKITYEYNDPVLKDLTTSEKYYTLVDGVMTLDKERGFERTIVRDEKNNITEFTMKTDNDRWGTSVCKFVYNAEGQVSSYTNDSYNLNGELEYSDVYDGIKWYKTDGQALPGAYDLRDMFGDYMIVFRTDPFMGDQNNKIETLSMSNDRFALHFNNKYDEQGRVISSNVNEANQRFYDTNIDYIDDFGSYTMKQQVAADVNGNGELDQEDIKISGQLVTQEYWYDEHGNVLRNVLYGEWMEPDQINDGAVYSYTYDEKGLMTEAYISMAKHGDTTVDTAELQSRYELYDYTEDSSTAVKDVDAARARISFANNMVYVNNAVGAIYSVRSIDGKMVMEGVVTRPYIDINGLPDGAYIVSVSGFNGSGSVKVIRR